MTEARTRTPRVLVCDLGTLAAGEGPRPEPFRDPDPALEALGCHGGSALALVLAARDPEAGTMVLSVGPNVVEGLPTAARVSVLGQAPLHGRLGEGFVGSDLGRRLARVTDALVLRGRAPGEGAVLEIDPEGELSLHLLPELMGETPGSLAEALAARLGPGASLRVGPAARAGVVFANLAAGGAHPSFVGRGGLGASFAGLGLLALHVRTEPVRTRAFPELEGALLASPRLAARSAAGTLEQDEALAMGAGDGARERARSRGEQLRSRREGVEGCSGCPTPCGWVFEGPEGRPQGGRFHALRPLGERLGLHDADDVLRLLAACNRLGLDAKETGDGLTLLGEGLGDVVQLEQRIEEIVSGEGAGAELAAGTDALARSRGLAWSRDDLPEGLGPVESLARRVGARGPEPMRTFPFLLERPEALPSGLRSTARDPGGATPEDLARLVVWHEDLVLGLDVLGFCAFSAAGLLTDEVVDLDTLATWLGLSSGVELLALGASVARLHRRLAPGEPALPENLREAGRAHARLRSAPPGGSPGAVLPRSEASPRPCVLPAGRGRVELRGVGSLAGRMVGGLQVELPLPASMAEVLLAAADVLPGTRSWLLVGDRPLPAVYRHGERLAPEDPVREGDQLDLILVIPGG